MNIILSVIVPIYNVENYLRKCLDSISIQNRKDIEVIMINDGATDNSGTIADAYTNNYSNFILVNQQNKGLSGARNTGIQHARGKYLWFVDSDDYLVEGSINKILRVCEGCMYDVISIDAIIERQREGHHSLFEKHRELAKEGAYSAYDIYKKGFVYPYSGAQYYIVKSEFLKNNNIFFKESTYYEDMLYTPTLLSKEPRCYYIRDCLYNYIERQGSITGTKITLAKCKQHLGISDELFSQYNMAKSKEGKKLLRDCILKMLSSYYHYFYLGLNDTKDKVIARKDFIDRKYLFKMSFYSVTPKYMLRCMQMLLK